MIFVVHVMCDLLSLFVFTPHAAAKKMIKKNFSGTPRTPAKDCVLCTPVYFTPLVIKQRNNRYFWRVIASANGERLLCDIL